MTLFGRRIPMMASLLVWALLWEVAGRLELVFLLPPLSDVFAVYTELIASQQFQGAVLSTLKSFSLGLAIAIAIGVPLGALMGRVKAFDRLFGMWVNVFVSAPLTALVPILMILFGIGETTIVVTVVLFSVWIIVLDTRVGIRDASASLLDMGRSFCASRWQLYTKIIVWAALPEILAGIRVGLIRGVKGVVIGQLLVSIVGLGELFELYSRSFLMDRFWALTILLFAFAMLLSEAIEYLERRIEYYAGARVA